MSFACTLPQEVEAFLEAGKLGSGRVGYLRHFLPAVPTRDGLNIPSEELNGGYPRHSTREADVCSQAAGERSALSLLLAKLCTRESRHVGVYSPGSPDCRCCETEDCFTMIQYAV
jgi:hypothetical protein